MKLTIDSSNFIGGTWNFGPSGVKQWNETSWLIGSANQGDDLRRIGIHPRNYNWREAVLLDDFGVNIVELNEGEELLEERFIAIGFAEGIIEPEFLKELHE